MATSGGKPSSKLSERQMVGLFSLGLGVVLFLLILVRGQQAAQEGNQEIRNDTYNDTYWLLVSPLVFSAFGVGLLRAPKGGVRGRAVRAAQPSETSSTVLPVQVVDVQVGEEQVVEEQVDQLRANETPKLLRVQAEVRAGADQSQRWVDELAGSLAAQMDQARQKLDAALQASQDAQTLVDRLEQSVFAAPPSAVANAITDPFLSCYREACEELGVLPGSPWQDVRATWRRNLLHWHPDQGGDPKLWSRRNAAYQLLVAWYEFNGVS